MRTLRLALVIAALTMAGPAVAKLTNSFIRDGARVCVYDDPRGDYTDPTTRSLIIDRNGDCPSSPLPPVVPALATLDSSSVVNGKRFCRYVHAGRFYTTAVDLGISCTYTPR